MYIDTVERSARLIYVNRGHSRRVDYLAPPLRGIVLPPSERVGSIGVSTSDHAGQRKTTPSYSKSISFIFYFLYNKSLSLLDRLLLCFHIVVSTENKSMKGYDTNEDMFSTKLWRPTLWLRLLS